MTAAAPRDAATVILLRESGEGAAFEVLLLQRPASQTFMGGAWVFPGGKVDARDGTGEEAIRRAAVRELEEEAGVTVRPEELVFWARWVTPPQEPVRFDARFFLALLPPGAVVRPDPHEVVDIVWLAPAAALARAAAGALRIMPPTLRNLELLGGHALWQSVVEAACAQEQVTIVPRVEILDGVFTIVLPGDPLHEDRERRVPGPTRIALRETGFVSEDPP